VDVGLLAVPVVDVFTPEAEEDVCAALPDAELDDPAAAVEDALEDALAEDEEPAAGYPDALMVDHTGWAFPLEPLWLNGRKASAPEEVSWTRADVLAAYTAPEDLSDGPGRGVVELVLTSTT